ncbi:MAG: hypothetical protein IID18_09235, partial [Nitrospinae bacterium]|nr:hypothetical protein [Nitrospinota bacterium]
GFLFQLNNYIFPFILLPLLFLKPLRTLRREVQLCLFCIVGIIVVSLLHTIPLQQYIAGSFPLWSILLAMVVMESLPNRPAARSALAATLILSNLIHIGPLLPARAVLKDHPEWFQNSLYLKHAYKSFMREVSLESVYYKHVFEISHPYSGPMDAVLAFFKTHGKPGDSCYIDNEPESLVFYTGMKVISREELTSRHQPDWIVLRGDDRIVDAPGIASPSVKIVKDILQANTYTRIDLDAPAMRVNNAPEIQIHLFRSPSSADKITVYQLTDRLPNPENT